MTAPAARHRPPSLGGFSPTLLRIELRRLMRNRRTVVFTLVLPVVFFELFGSPSTYGGDRAGVGNVTAYVLISMAVYGGMLASTSAGATVSIERAIGWTRQLRLTPLSPVAYVGAKLLAAVTVGGISIAVVYLFGSTSKASMPMQVWVESAIIAWLCTLVFAAFGLFMGYLLPSENVMQVIGPVLALLSFAGGLFVPVNQMGHTFADVAQFMPTYGVGLLARYPLVHDGSLPGGILNVVAWTAAFSAGAALLFRRDTARV